VIRRLAHTAAVGALLFALSAALAAAEPPAIAPPAPAPLDVAALAKQSRTLDVADDQLRAALVKGTPGGVAFSRVLDLGDGASAVAWSECSQAGCRGSIATMAGGKQTKKAALVAPAKVFFEDGFVFEPPAFADLDGDGASEIVLHYKTTEPPRAALGSMTREYVAVYAPKDLAVVFSHELRKTGAESEDACQWAIERSGDRLMASGECNKRSCLDAAGAGAGCKPNKKIAETWRKARGQKCYSRVGNAAVKAK
jgi:hypothetical protein